MTFPPLKDLDESAHPDDARNRPGANPGAPGDLPGADAPPPAPGAPRAGAPPPVSAPAPHGGRPENEGNDDSEPPAADTPAGGSDQPDEDPEELNPLVNFDEVDLDEVEFEDLVEHRAQNAPLAGDPHGLSAAAAGDIPMLTEVVQVPRYDTEDLPQTLADVDWGDLGQRVRENVLERLLRRSDALLDAQLQNTLTPVLERAAETVAHELHDALNRMIRDIVARAVTEELTRLHAEIAKRNRSTRQT